MKTIVIFRKFAPRHGGEVIALFPEIAADMSGNMQSYMHTGQHGAASPDLGRTLRLASPEEYAPIAAELTRLGYSLDIRQRSCPAYARTRRAQIENRSREPVDNIQTARRLVARARRLYALRLIDPRAPQYTLADSLMDRANLVLKTIEK